MRIAHVCYTGFAIPPASYGGVERQIYALASAQAARGDDVYLFAHPDSSVPGCSLVACPHQQTANAQFRTVMSYLQAARVKFDVVHDHTPYGMLGHTNTNARVVRTIYGDQNLLLRNSMREDAEHVFLSKAFAEFYGFPDAAVIGLSPISNMSETPFNGNIKSRENTACCIGNVADFKGVHVAIEWARRLSLRLHIYGPIKQEAYFRQRIQPFLSQGECEYIGIASEKIKWSILLTASCLFVPSLCVDNAPVIVQEAMLAGCPVLAHPIGGIPELLARTGGVASYNLKDICRFREWVNLHYDPVAARQHVISEFDITYVLEQLDEVYRR